MVFFTKFWWFLPKIGGNPKNICLSMIAFKVSEDSIGHCHQCFEEFYHFGVSKPKISGKYQILVKSPKFWKCKWTASISQNRRYNLLPPSIRKTCTHSIQRLIRAISQKNIADFHYNEKLRLPTFIDFCKTATQLILTERWISLI